jgi:hypothetical protein
MEGRFPYDRAYPISEAQFQALLAQLQQHQQPVDAFDPKDKHISRRRFSPEEDELLRSLVERLGSQDWNAVSQHFLRRTARQCRDRWKHYLCPELLPDVWTDEENQLLFAKVAEMGPHWAQVAVLFPGRTDIRVKNHYMALKTKREKESGRLLDSVNPIGPIGQ